MAKTDRPVLIEGYAALFGVSDEAGDIVRAGAFRRALERGPPKPPMLLQHRSGAIAGYWTRLMEDGRGLYVRGLIEAGTGLALVHGGLDGLSIGFRPKVWRPRPGGGRDLLEVDLVEVSLVADPMQKLARFRVLGLERKLAA